MYMEKRIKNKLDKQQIKFKTDIQEWVNDNNIFSENDEKRASF